MEYRKTLRIYKQHLYHIRRKFKVNIALDYYQCFELLVSIKQLKKFDFLMLVLKIYRGYDVTMSY